MIALVAGFIAAVICWWQWRSLESAQSTHQALSAALDQMRLDAERIAALREAPQQAADRKKPNEELLGQIERSLRSGNVPPELWQDSIPQPTQRVAQSPYQRYSTRLYFEAITLEQVLRFAHDLMKADPSLAVSSLHLSTPARAKPSTWNIDLTVDYLVYAPSKTNNRL